MSRFTEIYGMYKVDELYYQPINLMPSSELGQKVLCPVSRLIGTHIGFKETAPDWVIPVIRWSDGTQSAHAGILLDAVPLESEAVEKRLALKEGTLNYAKKQVEALQSLVEAYQALSEADLYVSKRERQTAETRLRAVRENYENLRKNLNLADCYE